MKFWGNTKVNLPPRGRSGVKKVFSIGIIDGLAATSQTFLRGSTGYAPPSATVHTPYNFIVDTDKRWTSL